MTIKRNMFLTWNKTHVFQLKSTNDQRKILEWAGSPGGGGGTPLYKPYRYVPPKRVGFLPRFGLKMGVDFAPFGLESGPWFSKELRECMNVFYGGGTGKQNHKTLKQNRKTQNKITKLKTESQNPKQKHKTQNRIAKPKTESQNSKRTKNSKQNHKTQDRNTN